MKKWELELSEIHNCLPKKLRKKLSFRKEGSYIAIRQKQRPNAHDFYKVAVAVMNFNGEYIQRSSGFH